MLDTLTYDLHVTYPQYGTHKGRLSIPTFTVYDTPGAGLFEYRVRITTTIAQGGAASPPTLSFQGVLLNLELQQNKR